MPLYTYDCTECGPFQATRTIAEFEFDAECPGCGGSGRRTLAAPTLMTMPAHTRQAHARNEKSAWSPDLVRRESDAHVHSAHCGHLQGHSDHRHAHHGGKPWMLGHSH